MKIAFDEACAVGVVVACAVGVVAILKEALRGPAEDPRVAKWRTQQREKMIRAGDAAAAASQTPYRTKGIPRIG